jgi:hypothetical protein
MKGCMEAIEEAREGSERARQGMRAFVVMFVPRSD